MDSCARDLAAAYALDALPAESGAAFARHLTRCRRCRTEVDVLLEAASALALALPAVDPLPALRDRIMAASVRLDPERI